jgi:hypothetical protein
MHRRATRARDMTPLPGEKHEAGKRRSKLLAGAALYGAVLDGLPELGDPCGGKLFFIELRDIAALYGIRLMTALRSPPPIKVELENGLAVNGLSVSASRFKPPEHGRLRNTGTQQSLARAGCVQWRNADDLAFGIDSHSHLN